MNLCTEISDAEPRTGQRNALCVVTPEQEIFIRDDNKEIINGSVGDPGVVTAGDWGGGVLTDVSAAFVSVDRWSEQLAVYLRTNKLNPKKKRKVEPVATQVQLNSKSYVPV